MKTKPAQAVASKSTIKNSLDQLFSKKHKKEIEKKHEEEEKKKDPNGEIEKERKKVKVQKQMIKIQREQVKEEKRQSGGKVKITEDGYKVYTSEELGLGKGGNTDDCPFDCDCCF